MPSRILNAVAAPPKMLFVPVQAAGGNMVFHVTIMMLFQSIFTTINPLIFLLSAVIGHILLIIWGFKEPHMSTLIQARGKSMRRSKNLIKPKGYRSRYAA